MLSMSFLNYYYLLIKFFSIYSFSDSYFKWKFKKTLTRGTDERTDKFPFGLFRYRTLKRGPTRVEHEILDHDLVL